MKPLICEKCCRNHTEFITRIEGTSCEIILPGLETKRHTIIIDGPVAICPDCGSRMYCEEFEKINLDNYCKEIEELKKKRINTDETVD